MRKNDGAVRVQAFHGLNALLTSQSGGRWDFLTFHDEMDKSTYFTCLDLTLGFLKLAIHEGDRHLTGFRDAEGNLWEYIRSGFDLKTVPLPTVNYVGGSIIEVMNRGVRWYYHSNPHIERTAQTTSRDLRLPTTKEAGG